MLDPDELARSAHERNHQQLSEFNGMAAASAENAVKAAGLINGGAAVALLALVGNIADSSAVQKIDKQVIALCFTIYVFGVLFAAAASGAAYFVNYCNAASRAFQSLGWKHPYVEETARSRRWAHGSFLFHVVAIFLVFASYGTFVWASVKARDVLITVITAPPSAE